jgi:anti-sigma B factor antagonist
MIIKEEIRLDVAVLKISGDLMDGPDVAKFRDHIRHLIKDGIKNVVVDFSKIKWFGSSMLGVLTASLAILRKVEGDIRITGITDRINSLLMVTHLAGAFHTFSSVGRAVASFTTR